MPDKQEISGKYSRKAPIDFIKELLTAFWLFLLLYAVLAFADFGTGFVYSGF